MQIKSLLIISLSLISARPCAAMDASQINEAYYAIKPAIYNELDRQGQLVSYQSDYISLTSCSDVSVVLGTDNEANQDRYELANTAYEILHIKLGLSDRIPAELWRPELVALEEELLRLHTENAPLPTRAKRLNDYRNAVSARINAENKRRGGRWPSVRPDAFECGAGEVLVTFEVPPHQRAQYIHKVYYDICTAGKVAVPPGYCDWNDYGGGNVMLSGRYKVRLAGSTEAPLDMTVEDLDNSTGVSTFKVD